MRPFLLLILLFIPHAVFAGALSHDRTLRLGSSGAEVLMLQQDLNLVTSTATPIQLTGYFGPVTERAVKRFQEHEGIATTGDRYSTGYGVVGPRTRTMLRVTRFMHLCPDNAKPTRQACLGDRYEEFAHAFGAAKALKLIEAHVLRERYFDRRCHEIMHRIGHAGAKEFGTLGAAFPRGTDLCQNGYYHGVVEAFLKEKKIADVSKEELRGLCAAASSASSTHPVLNCVHGLGHGLVYMTDRDLPRALVRCSDLSKDDERGECAAGAFMQYAFAEALTGAREGASNNVADPCKNAFFDGGVCWLNESAKVIAASGDSAAATVFCNALEAVHRDACLLAIPH